MNKSTFEVKLECVEAGQRRKYGDSHYHYRATGTQTQGTREFDVPAEKLAEMLEAEYYMGPLPKHQRSDAREWHESYWEMKTERPGYVEYKWVKPSTH